MSKITFNLNGETVTIEEKTGEVLADMLRERLGLTGTKVACREGECGACTVLLDGRPPWCRSDRAAHAACRPAPRRFFIRW